ncbi:MAG: protein kinase [Planctomycetota bacterium]
MPVLPPTVPEDAWREGQTILEDFEVLERLGQGALGSVYVVLESATNRRYAVKRIRFADNERQTRFLTELEAWMYLPEHPNLVGCRFARLLGDEVLIFIDCVQGSSLDKLIANKRLYVQDAAHSLERILDIAIQLAWGLEAVHKMKVMHQDVRPSNVFVLNSGIVKITDIGLAQATALGTGQGAQAKNVVPGSLIVYRPLAPAADKDAAYVADVWNWGASVLEMFAAGLKPEAAAVAAPPKPEAAAVTAPPKPEAAAVIAPRPLTNPDIMERVQQASAVQPPCPAMPQPVAGVLQKCFTPQRYKLWSSLGEVAELLRQIYGQVAKKAYPRRTPAAVHRGTLLAIAHARWQPGGGAQWSTPQEWMNEAMGVAKRGGTILLLKPSRAFSQRTQALADMPGYVKAEKIFEREVAAGRKDMQYLYAILCSERAFLHVSLNELATAVEYFGKTIRILGEMVDKEGREELANDLAFAYLNRAVALKNLGNLQEAVEVYQKAIEIWERLVKREGRQELTANQAWAKALRGEALFRIADETQALVADTEKKAADARARAQAYMGDMRAEADPAKAAQRVKEAHEQNETAKQLATQASEARRLLVDRRTLARREAPGGLSLLRSEVRRTMRSDLKAILRWAESVFDGRL